MSRRENVVFSNEWKDDIFDEIKSKMLPDMTGIIGVTTKYGIRSQIHRNQNIRILAEISLDPSLFLNGAQGLDNVLFYPIFFVPTNLLTEDEGHDDVLNEPNLDGIDRQN